MRALLLTLLLFFPLYAYATDANTAPPTATNGDAPPPPNVVDDPNDAPPQVTIKHKGTEKVEEYRTNGHLYMIRVTPANGRPYYLVDTNGNGQFVRQDLLHNGVKPPMWVLHQW